MSLLEVLFVVLFLIFLAFLALGPIPIIKDRFWQRVRLFIEREGKIATGADDNEQRIKEIWKTLSLKERLTARLPYCRF